MIKLRYISRTAVIINFLFVFIATLRKIKTKKGDLSPLRKVKKVLKELEPKKPNNYAIFSKK